MAKAKTAQAKTLKVTQIKSVIGTKESHRACVRGLGLRRMHHTVEVEDTPAVRGMINKVYYLVKCEA
ncbi:MAG TPA: 50S ribosomal protein L30 [Sideroxyarcus sp.]|nr:50S ribosomal protein L30 [Sideroxyarcus sp.]